MKFKMIYVVIAVAVVGIYLYMRNKTNATIKPSAAPSIADSAVIGPNPPTF